MQNGTDTLKRVWQFLMKLNIYLVYDMAISLLGKDKKSKDIYLHKNLYLNISNDFILHQKDLSLLHTHSNAYQLVSVPKL